MRQFGILNWKGIWTIWTSKFVLDLGMLHSFLVVGSGPSYFRGLETMQYVRMLVNWGLLVFQCIAKQRGRCLEPAWRMTVELAWTVQEELETLLDETGHLRTLAFLYASKGMSSKALAIWRILARNYSSGLWKDPNMENGSQDSNNNIISGKEIAATEASKILEESSDQELILQHLGWVCAVLHKTGVFCGAQSIVVHIFNG